MRNSFQFLESKNNIVLTVKTLCAEKWLLLDRETGQIYQGNASGHWDKLEPKVR